MSLVENETKPARAAKAAKPESLKAGKPEPKHAWRGGKPKAEAPDAEALALETSLKAMSKGDLADAWGALKEQDKALRKKLDAHEAEFIRRKLKGARGALFSIEKTVSSWMGLRIADIKTAMGAAWCAKWQVENERVEFKARRIEKAAGK